MTDPLAQLSDLGVSIWLDDLSRSRIRGGGLADMIRDDSIVGVTTNPSIFAKALADGDAYADQVRELAKADTDVATAIEEITTTDVAEACDEMEPVFERTRGKDGCVSIEVSPRLAHDTEGTLASARTLWNKVDRENLFIKIPATDEGLPAITQTLAEGISVNVTLIFGLDRYEQVMRAYVDGIKQAHRNGHDLSSIRSVASFFVSRVDVEIDDRLDEAGADADLKGKAGIANARLAFQAYEQFFDSEEWAELKSAGATEQRPLWASTGVKNPDYRDTMYVVDLAVDGTVNTMPEDTLRAVADHGDVQGDQVHGHYDDAQAHMDALAAAGIDYDDVIAVLEREGVEKFEDAWGDLEGSVREQLEQAKASE